MEYLYKTHVMDMNPIDVQYFFTLRKKDISPVIFQIEIAALLQYRWDISEPLVGIFKCLQKISMFTLK